MPTRHEVEQFLADFRAAVTLGYHRWLPRVADRQHLIDLGITENLALDVIRSLGCQDYASGPDPDDWNPNREVWVFGKEIEGTKAYIKLALQPDPKRKNVAYGLIWSFHAAQHPMKHPFAEESP